MIDIKNAKFEDKPWTDEGWRRTVGMRHRTTRRKHGVARCHYINAGLFEASYKDGRLHGLKQWVRLNHVEISLWRNGLQKAEFHFDHDFQEMIREDEDNLLVDLSPADFRL